MNAPQCACKFYDISSDRDVTQVNANIIKLPIFVYITDHAGLRDSIKVEWSSFETEVLDSRVGDY